MDPATASELTAPTKEFIVPVGPPIPHLVILGAKFRNLTTGDVFFEAPAPTDKSQPDSPSSLVQTTLASIPRNQLFHYEFGISFFQLECFGISLKIQTGEQALPNVRLIENYFIGQEKIKTFQFAYGRLEPNIVTTWDLVYDLPPSFTSLEKRVRNQPDERIFADTFLFNGNNLLQHNKAVISFAL